MAYLRQQTTQLEVSNASNSQDGDNGSSSGAAKAVRLEAITPKSVRSSQRLTYLLIVANLTVFFLMVALTVLRSIFSNYSGGFDLLLPIPTSILVLFGAKVNSLIMQGEYWRFLTSMFLHLDLLHLAFNLYALWALGPITEDLLGRWRYLAVYFLSGIAGSVASFFFTNAISAGASGAIFGLLGALVAYSRQRPGLWKSGFAKNLIIVIVINLGLNIFQPGIDISAHLGGLIIGLALGFLLP